VWGAGYLCSHSLKGMAITGQVQELLNTKVTEATEYLENEAAGIYNPNRLSVTSRYLSYTVPIQSLSYNC